MFEDDTRTILWEFEDNLEIDLTDEMFLNSKIVDGVRMYPYIEVDFVKYFLEGNMDK